MLVEPWRRAMAGGVPSGSAPESMGKEAEEDEELTTNPFWGLVWAGDDRRDGSTVRGGATIHGGLKLRFSPTQPRRG